MASGHDYDDHPQRCDDLVHEAMGRRMPMLLALEAANGGDDGREQGLRSPCGGHLGAGCLWEGGEGMKEA